MSLKKWIIVCLFALNAEAAHRRALLIGIDDYSASRIPQRASAVPGRDLPNLSGSLNDVASMRELLILLHGFAPSDIVTLTDQTATRSAILQSIETQLIAPAQKDDIVFFFYAGHGSQVVNTRSDEPDHLDESIVPADSRRGAPDIRDKELRRLFNRILDRGARLTIMLDDCHSGSGARGLPVNTAVRGVRADGRDVRDGADAGPRPEDRGAIVLTASQDFEIANETQDAGGTIRGAFTWAWMRAMRDASPGESTYDTFLRAQSRLRNETPYQEPVLAATPRARRTPFLGTRVDGDRLRVAVIKVEPDGSVRLQGGWANGIAVGSTLRSPRASLTVTKLLALGQSIARVDQGRVEPGMLLEPAGWVAAPARPLRVCMPHVATSTVPIEGIAHLLTILAKRRHLKWINDPTTTTPQYVVRVGADHGKAEDALNAIPFGASVFVQLPAPASLVQSFDAIESTNDPASADYILTGRYANRKLTYAWVRPGVTREDRRKSGLPVRSSWLNASSPLLAEAVLRLRKIVAWQQLESPPVGRSPYHLALRRDSDDSLVTTNATSGGTLYRAVLRGDNLPPRVSARFIYLFVIDSHGRSILLFPRATAGSVENHFPLNDTAPPPHEIPITRFTVAPPYGVDTYFLLTTDEPLPNPSILEWDGVGRAPHARTALERLLIETGIASRSVLTPQTWSIERVTFESTPQKRKRGV